MCNVHVCTCTYHCHIGETCTVAHFVLCIMYMYNYVLTTSFNRIMSVKLKMHEWN